MRRVTLTIELDDGTELTYESPRPAPAGSPRRKDGGAQIRGWLDEAYQAARTWLEFQEFQEREVPHRPEPEPRCTTCRGIGKITDQARLAAGQYALVTCPTCHDRCAPDCLPDCATRRAPATDQPTYTRQEQR